MIYKSPRMKMNVKGDSNMVFINLAFMVNFWLDVLVNYYGTDMS